MYIYLVLAALFGWGFIENLTNGQVDWTEASTCLLLSGMGIFMFFWIQVSHSRSRQTIEWLLENKDQITSDEQFFRNSPVFDKAISKKTKLRSFKIVTSVVFLTSENELGLEIRKGIWAGLFATVWTLLLGWWGLPWGPIRTIRALAHNLGGGKTITVDYAILSEETGWNFETGEGK